MKPSKIAIISLLALLLALPAVLIAQDDAGDPEATEEMMTEEAVAPVATEDAGVEAENAGDPGSEAVDETFAEATEEADVNAENAGDPGSEAVDETFAEATEEMMVTEESMEMMTEEAVATEEAMVTEEAMTTEEATASAVGGGGAADGDLMVYTVQPGDTLFRIALRNGTTVSAIAQENDINNVSLIFAGQQLRIPGTTSDDGGDDDSDDGSGDDGTLDTYTVQRGDTLSAIARRFDTTFQAIAEENDLADPNRILVGQVLRIPGTTGDEEAEETPTPEATEEPDDSDGGVDGEGTTYTVRSGDTLSSIARRFGVSTAAIAQANGIVNPNLIFVGQVLNIPGATGGDGGDGGDGSDGGSASLEGFALGGQVFSFSYPELMRETGLEWAKVQVRWSQGQTAEEAAQGAIDAARSRDFKVLLSIVGEPDELAANPTQYYQDFAIFLGEVAALEPDAIEVWNEMNIDREWPSGQISGQNYTQMLSAGYQAIKNANPNVLVISGAPAPTGFFGGCTPQGCDDNFYIRDMANAGAAQFMDCVGVHYNEGIVAPSATSGDPRGNSSHYSRYYNGMVSLYASTFPSTPLCFTELGYLSPDGFDIPLPDAFSWAQNTTVQQQGQYLAEAIQLAQQNDRVDMVIIWNVDSTLYSSDPQAAYAIVRPDDTCPACNQIAQVVN